jgi:hypothetical protein
VAPQQLCQNCKVGDVQQVILHSGDGYGYGFSREQSTSRRAVVCDAGHFHVQDAVLPRIFNLRPDLNPAQQAEWRQVAVILQGNAKPGKHAADASHISEAAETGCAYFITEDNRILDERAELSRVLPLSLAIVTLMEFFDAFDRA